MLKRVVLLTLLVCGCQAVEKLDEKPVIEPPVMSMAKVNNTRGLIRIEFVISLEDKLSYPEAFKSFLDAAFEWTRVLPIELSIFVPSKASGLSTMGTLNQRRGAVLVSFETKIKSPVNTDRLGTFDPSSNILALDMSDFYNPEFKPMLARAVVLHEIGHVFGLPHIFNAGSLNAHMGDLMVASGAENMLMAPFIDLEIDKIEISSIEIQHALSFIKVAFGPRM